MSDLGSIKSKMNFSLFSEYRTAIMGMAALFIVAFHACTPYEGQNNTALFLLRQLNVGVEMFLLASGTGLYFSFSKNGNQGFFKYYGKRLINVYLIYLLIAFPITLYYNIKVNGTVLSFMSDWTGVAFFFGKRYASGNRGAWYVMFVMVLYAVYPIVFKIQKALEKRRLDLATAVLFAAVTAALCYLFKENAYEAYSKYEIALTRLPAFIIGSYMGKLVYNKKPFTLFTYAAAAFGLFTYLFWLKFSIPFVDSRFVKLPLAVFICFAFVIALSLLKLKYINSFFSFFGGFSLELYLTHNLMNGFLFEKGHSETILRYALIVAVSIPLSFALSKLRLYLVQKYNTIIKKAQE